LHNAPIRLKHPIFYAPQKQAKQRRDELLPCRSGVAANASSYPLQRPRGIPSGNTTDAKTLLPVIERMSGEFPGARALADRGMVSKATLSALGRMDPPVHYIVGMRMRRTKEVAEVVLKSNAPWIEITPERKGAKDPAPLKLKEVKVQDRRYVVCRGYALDST
jgi:hypothetical protein